MTVLFLPLDQAVESTPESDLSVLLTVLTSNAALAAIVVIVGAGAARIMKNGSFSSSLPRRLPVRSKESG